MISQKEISEWYAGLRNELKAGFLSEQEKKAFVSYYSDAGLFRWWRRTFFVQHFCPPFMAICNFLFEGNAAPVILDLGCGMGTQSIFLALHGAKLIAIDMDPLALSIFEKRKKYYERLFSRKLDITIINRNAFKLSLNDFPEGGIDGFFSIFAFNMMKPAESLLGKVCSFLKASGKIAVLDGNNMCWLSNIFPSRRRKVLSPDAFELELGKNGFYPVSHSGVIAVPSVFWNLDLLGIVEAVNRILSRNNWNFPVSHLLLASKK